MDRMVSRMADRPEVLAIIPARGGSKGIPRKNIKLFAGFPLIAYSIAAAKQSELVTRVIVSTDDAEIAAVSREWGAETPFLRPSEFATDHAQDLPVFRHALEWLTENEGYRPEIVVQLRPTSPIRSKTMVDDAVRLLIAHPEADSVRGVVPSGENPYKMWRIDPVTGAMQGLLKVDGLDEPYNAPRQILPATYWQTGHIDAIRPDRTFMVSDKISGDVVMPLMVDPAFTVDIDTPDDWARYETLVYNGNLDLVLPGSLRRVLPEKISLVVMDFDGVFTDDRVFLDQNGIEMVVCSRSDGMGISRLKQSGVRVTVISSEANPVVSRRCEKLGIEVFQGVADKATLLTDYLHKNSIAATETVYIGNDINDTPCFPLVSCAVVPADANQKAKDVADIILQRKGGLGAIRELCEMILR